MSELRLIQGRPGAGPTPAERVGIRGYQPLYSGSATPCPGCGRSHWYRGRRSAECAFCMTALPLAPEAAA